MSDSEAKSESNSEAQSESNSEAQSESDSEAHDSESEEEQSDTKTTESQSETTEESRDLNSRVVKNTKKSLGLTKDELRYWNNLSSHDKRHIIDIIKYMKKHKQSYEEVPFKFKILNCNIPISTKEIILSKWNSFQTMSDNTSEYHKQQKWFTNLNSIPLGIYRNIDTNPPQQFLENVKKTLDETVYGQGEVKNQLLKIIAQWISNPFSKGNCIGIQGPMGVGKCLAFNTEILMYDGTIKKVQDIQIGDKLMGDDSTPRNVVSLGQGRDKMYKITHNKTNDSYIVNSEHILTLKFKKSIVDIPLKEYLKLPKYIQKIFKGYHANIEFPELNSNEIEDPYLLGLSLDTELSYCCNITDLHKISLMKTCSAKQRLEFLAGVIDSIGYSQTFYSIGLKDILKLDTYYEDLVYIIKSLGISIVTKNSDIILSGGLLHRAPIKCLNKKVGVKQDTLSITITELPEDNYYGFELDANNRFVLGNFIVTHNTSLIKDGLAKAINLPFSFITLGGATDGALLEGHSFTYEGSHYGKICESLIKSKCMNPILFFDELDKVSNTYRGDEIYSILTHITDSTQNEQFYDRYFSEIELDISKSLMIFSFNDETTISPILKDRMIIIRVPGYNVEEKIIISKEYLIPKLLEQYNISKTDIVFPDNIISEMIALLEPEKGVRTLKRNIESIIGWLNMYRYVPYTTPQSNKRQKLTIDFPVTISEGHLKEFMSKSDLEKKNMNTSHHSMYI